MSTPGGIDGGQISLPIVGDATGLERDVQIKVDAALARVRGQIKVAADTSQARRDIDALRTQAMQQVQIKVDADTAAARAKIDALTSGRGGGVTVTVDADTAPAQTKIDALLARYGAARITIRVDADTSAAENALRRTETSRRSLTGRTTVTVAESGAAAAAGAINSVANALIGLGKGVGIATGVVELAGAFTQLVGAAGALTAAVGPAVNLLGLLPAAGAAAAQGILAVVAGFAGITDAVKQTQQAQAQQAQTAGTNAKAQEAATQRVINATQALQDAQRQQARQAVQGTQQVEDAQQRLNRAITDGAQRVQQAQQQVQRATADGADRVRQAQQRLAEAGGGGATSGARRGAGDSASVVRESQQVMDARTRLARAEQDAADRISQAEDRIRKAQQDAADTAAADARTITQAQQNIADVTARSAQRIQDAQNREAAAEQTLADRQARAQKAQETLTQARKDAQRTLDEMALALKGSALDEEDAALAVVRAKQQLDRVNRSAAATGTDRQEADLAYRQALQRQQEVAQRNKELTQDATAAQQAGVEGAANVVQAKADVAQAQQDIVNAQNDVVKAQQEVVDAQAQAARDLADAQQRYSDALAKAAKDAKDAQANITAAQADYTRAQRQNARELSDANTALARAQAQQARDIAAAQHDLLTAQADSARTISDAQRSLAQTEADNARTIGDARTALQRAKATAGQSAADAARTVARAEADLTAARRTQTETVDKESAAQRNLEQTYKSLGPEARRFVTFLVNQFLPAIRGIRKQAQAGLLPGVQKALETLLPYAGAIGRTLRGTGQIIGDLAAAGARLITSGPFRRDFGNIAQTNDQVIRSVGDTFLNLLDVFRNLIHEGAPLVQRFALAVERASARLRDATQRKRDDGSLFTMLEDAYNTGAKLGHILVTLGRALFSLGHAGRPAGNSLLQSLSDMVDKFSAWAASPQGQKAASDFFQTAADGIRAFAGPLADIGKILNRTNQLQGLADALGAVAGALVAISNIPGFGPVVDFLFKAAGAAIGIGLLLKVFKPLYSVFAGMKALGRIVFPGAPKAGAGGAGGTGTEPGKGVQRVTWGPTALPVRIVGGGAPGSTSGPGGIDPFDPADPSNHPAGAEPPVPGTRGTRGETWLDPNDPNTTPYGPVAPTRGQRLRTRLGTAASRVGRATGVTQVRGFIGTQAGALGTAVQGSRLGRMGGGRVGGVTRAVGRGAGRLGATGALGMVAMAGGDMLANVITGNSKPGSGRSIAGGALGGAVQGGALGATIGSIIPGVGTAIGAAVGAAIGAIYGAIKAGLTFKKVVDLLAATGRGIKTAWDDVVGPVVRTVRGWWDDIVHWTQHLADVLVGHSIIPDMVKKIRDVFGWLLAPVTTFIGWFRNDLPNAAQALLTWVSSNWSKVTDLFRRPIEAFLGWVTGRDTGMGSLRGTLVSIVSFVTSPQRFAWHLIQGIFDKPVKAFLSWLTGRNTGLGWLKQSFTAVLTWVTSPASWNWGRILGTIERPIKDAIDFLTGRGSGWAKIRQSFTSVLSWVTSPGTWNWASRVLSVVTSPITSAYNWLTGRSSGFARIRAAFTSVKDWVTGAFKREWNGLKAIITDPVDAARNALTGAKGLLSKITGAFGSFVSGAGSKLSGLRSVWASPIHFVLDTVINKGLIGAFNRLAKLLPGLSEIGTVNIPAALQPRSRANPNGYATGTANMVLPGYTPGRDVHRFTSPTGGAIDLSGGESILRPEVTRAVGAGWVNAVNRAAMSGGMRGVTAYLGGYWGGGVLGKIKGAAGAAWNGIKGAAGAVKRGVLGATDAVGDAAGAAAGAAKSTAAALGGILTDPVGWVKDKIKGALGGLGRLGNSSIVQAAKALPKAAADGILSRIQDAVSSMFGGSGEPVVWPVGHVPLGPGFGAGGSRWGHTGGRHTGQDFEVPTGTPVHPALAGIVQIIRSMPPGQSYGNYVELSHGPTLHTLYAHLSKFLVKVGDRITPNDVLGLSGATGNASGPHLHFEVREGGGTGHPVDPMPYLQGKKGPTAASGGGRGSTPMQWAGQVAQVLAMLGQPQTMAGAVLRRIGFESTGNPTVVNRTDSNWRAGHPSVGLMQVIADTFRAYAGPFVKTGPYEYGVSTNPLANIYAGTNYAIHRYGSLSNIDPLNRPKGYDLGGVLHPGQRGINLTNDPEVIFNAEQARTLHALVSQAPAVQQRNRVITADQLEAALRGSRPVQVDVHPAPFMDEVTLAKRTAFELEWAL